mmetsp:Transcript_33104/g.76350  ORF Transcript_33104/g.76350 Transcript_33104/m.76350 type:complete len:150 (+) Transcript_33104:445-894(+)
MAFNALNSTADGLLGCDLLGELGRGLTRQQAAEASRRAAEVAAEVGEGAVKLSELTKKQAAEASKRAAEVAAGASKKATEVFIFLNTSMAAFELMSKMLARNQQRFGLIRFTSQPTPIMSTTLSHPPSFFFTLSPPPFPPFFTPLIGSL